LLVDSEDKVYKYVCFVARMEENKISSNKVGQEQIHGLLFGEQLSWQSIIYDLINTEQLDPWDIDISLLANKYLEKVRELEEANLFVSSKVLFAASLLLRIKSEILLNHHLPGLDDILFGREDKKKYVQERMELEEEVPGLIQRTPLPRHKKVTLQELMSALGKAVKTENRRIQKVVTAKQQEIETAIAIPKSRINIRDSIKSIYGKLKEIFSSEREKVAFSEFVDNHNGGKKVEAFVPLLHLDNQHRVLLEQENHLDEIWIWSKQWHNKRYEAELEKMRREVEIEAQKELLENEKEIDDKKESE
jgi:segregation and condensation protein A